MIGKRVRAFVLATCVPLAAWAGSTQTGTLRGTVLDSNGEPVVGALVTLGSPSLIRERAVLTDAQGAFFAPGLPAGDYDVRVVVIDEEGSQQAIANAKLTIRP